MEGSVGQFTLLLLSLLCFWLREVFPGSGSISVLAREVFVHP